jgi:hypothetical protein
MRALLVLTCAFAFAFAFAGTARAAAGQPCATMALYDLARRGGAPFADIGFGDRPTDIRATFDSAIPGHTLRVHAAEGVSDERALQVLGFFDDAWTQQVDEAGFPPPLADGVEGGDARFDVFVVPLPDGLAGVTIANEDTIDDDGKHASPSFIQLDPTLSDSLLEVFAHHEFQHALQFAIDTEEPIMWFEATAVFWEVRTDPLVDDWTNSLPDFQGSPHVPFFVDGAVADELSSRSAQRYEYGAALFALYLDEVHGDGSGTFLREVWQATPQPDDVEENEPDFVDALSDRIDVGVALVDFANWRTLVGALSVEGDGPAEPVPESATLFALNLNAATLDGDQVVTDEFDGPYAYGCVVRRVSAPANVDVMPVEVRAEAQLEGQLLRAALLVTEADLAAPLVRRQSAEAAASLFEQVDVPANHILQVAICDVTAADPEDDVVHRPISLSVLRTDVDFPDAGPPPADDAGVVVDAGPDVPPPPPMCGCQSVPQPQPQPQPGRGGRTTESQRTRLLFSLFAIGATIVAFTVRGARHVKRGTTMKPTKKRDGT